MKIINPFNLIMLVVIYLVTFHYLRSAPTVINGRVGWADMENGNHAIAYAPMTGNIMVYSLQPDGKLIEGHAIPDGKISSWFRTPTVYRSFLHRVVGDYLQCKYDVETGDE